LKRAWAIALLPVLPLLVGLGTELEDVDPAQYADVARHIDDDGQWFQLEDTYGPFVNKPPLSLWTQAVAFKLLGQTSFAARLPILLLGLLAMFGVYRIGKALFDERRAIWATAFFASTVAFQQMVSVPKVDMALTATSTLAIAAFVEARNRPWWRWAGWLCCGLAVLSKGPLGLGIAGLAIAPEAARWKWGASERGPLVKRLFALSPVRGLAIVALVTAPYYRAMFQAGGEDAFIFVLWKQGFGRLIGQSGFENDTTPAYFLHTGAWAFLPLTPLLLVALALAARRLWKERTLPPDPKRIVWWWLLLPFAVFSLSDYKLPQYVFCLAPAVALICADLLASLSATAVRRVERIGIATAVGGALLSAAVVTLGVPQPGLIALAILFAGFALAPLRAAPTPDRAASIVIASLVGFQALWQLWAYPRYVAFQGGQELGEKVRSEDPNGKFVALAAMVPWYSLTFYARRPAIDVAPNDLKGDVVAGRTQLLLALPETRPDFAAIGLEAEKLGEYPHYPTSRPNLRFLRAATRDAEVPKLELWKLKAK
jgi:4-amino-4-deoxy-L-arabinose transferase-like glycosyltransferase